MKEEIYSVVSGNKTQRGKVTGGTTSVVMLLGGLALLAGCAGHASTHYSINYLRADKDALFIHYDKESYVGMSTLLNVHGSTLWDSRSCHYEQLAKADIKDGDVVDLQQGVSHELSCSRDRFGSDSMLYRDDDFLVEEYHGFFSQPKYGNDAYETWATVTTRGIESTIKCPPLPKLYARSRLYPLRVEDKLIVCGKIISVGGKPEEGPPLLFGYRYEPGMVHDGAIYFLVREHGHEHDFDRVKEGPVEITKFDAHSYQPMGKVASTLDWKDVGFYGEYGSGFLFVDKKYGADRSAYGCTGERCRRFILLNYFHFEDALLLEESGDELLLLLKVPGPGGMYRVKFVKAEEKEIVFDKVRKSE